MQLCQSSCWLRVVLSRIRAVAVAGRHLAHETCGRWAVSGAVSCLSDRGLCIYIETVSPKGTFFDTVQVPSDGGDMELI